MSGAAGTGAAPASTSAAAPALEQAGELWRWWTAELAAMLPRRLGQRLLAGPPVLVADLLAEAAGEAGPAFRFGRIESGAWRPLRSGETPAGTGLPVWLRLPERAVLARRLDWPAMPASDLRRAAQLDLDRQTPCAAETLWFDVALLDRDPARRRVAALLVVAPAAEVEAALAALRERHGLVADRVTVEPAALAPPSGEDPMPDAIAARIALRPAAAADAVAEGVDAGRGRAWLRRLLPDSMRGRLLLLCAVLGMVNLVLHDMAEERRIERLEQAVAEARQRAARADRLRTQITERRQMRDNLMSSQGDVALLAVLDRLTRAIPDGAWLDSVEVRGGSVYVTGYAPEATSLVALIESSPMFADAQFRSPVTPDRTAGGAGRERFDMAIGLKGRP